MIKLIGSILALAVIVIGVIYGIKPLTKIEPVPKTRKFGTETRIMFVDFTDAMKTGWEGSETKGAAVTVWGVNLGNRPGSVMIGRTTLNQQSDFAEWGATDNPTTARGLERVTFWLNSSIAPGRTALRVTTSNGFTSNSLPFYCRSIGLNHIYFISPTGNDSNDGLSVATAWRTAKKAREIEAGDIIYLKAGIYANIDSWDAVIDFWSNNHNNGSENNYIGVASYPGEVAQIGDNTTQCAIRRHGTSEPDHLSYWTFSKFILRGNGSVTAWANRGSSDHIKFIGNDISTTYGGKSAASFSGADGGQQYLYFYGNYACDASVDSRGQTAPTKAYPLYLGGYGWHNYIYIGWNEFAYNEWGQGIQLYGHNVGDWIDNIYIHDNYFHHNGMYGAVLGGGDPTSGNYEFIRNCYFYNNIVAFNGHRGYAGMIVGGVGGGDNGGNWHIYNNIFYHNNNGEINVGGSPDSVVVKNNIIISNPGEGYYEGLSGDFLSGNNNCYFGGGIMPYWDDESINADPQFIENSFVIGRDSPCKDVGDNSVISMIGRDYMNITRPQNRQIDIGAFETRGLSRRR